MDEKEVIPPGTTHDQPVSEREEVLSSKTEFIAELISILSDAKSFDEVKTCARRVLFAVERNGEGYFIPKSVVLDFNLMFRDLGLPTPALRLMVDAHRETAQYHPAKTTSQAFPSTGQE